MRSSIFFAGRGKERTWNTWKQYDELTDVLDYISVFPSQENLTTALRTLGDLSSCFTIEHAHTQA